MKKLLFFLIACAYSCLPAQVYVKAKTRQRFAQTVFGIDMQMSSGGSGAFINKQGAIQSFKFDSQVSPRIYISGTHFWGHAEFYFAFPVVSLRSLAFQNLHYSFSQSDIFGTKIYPWPIREKKFRPFVGFSISGINYRQYTNNSEGSGPAKSIVQLPLLAGINYCRGNYLLEAGISYNYSPHMNYYISRSASTNIYTPPLIFRIGIRRWLETTIASEKNYLDGSTQAHFENLKKHKKLNSWFIGLGPSSASYTKRSPFNHDLFPFMSKPPVSIFPEVSLGYYYQPFGMHLVLVGRHNAASAKAYGLAQTFKRTALTLECYKYLFDYNGFDPYVGACLSYEWLGFSQTGSAANFSVQKQMPAPGFIFGWDILPDKLQGITLRTNLRYFPNLSLEPLPGKKVFLNQLEFNFIQLIVYPQRLKNFRAEYSREH